MALVLKSDAVTSGNQTGDWYMHDTPELAGVTNLPTNPEIGLNNIILFGSNENQRNAKVVCAGVLKTVVGDINVTIFESKTTPGTMYVRAPQVSRQGANGEVERIDEVKLTNKIRAQVLRYMHTQVVMQDTPAVAPTGTGEFANTTGINMPPVGQPQPQPQPTGQPVNHVAQPTGQVAPAFPVAPAPTGQPQPQPQGAVPTFPVADGQGQVPPTFPTA